MELPIQSGSGYVDNLLITKSGNIALVECKLWRNPEARREVIGQIIDYAKDLSAWTYEKLQEAISRTKSLDGAMGQRPRSLYEAIAASAEIDEKTFVDSVSRNLRNGRFLLLIVGDGIREGIESMTEFLQQYAGLHFTLALVELALFEVPVPTGGYIAQPRVLARTKNIDRGIVTVDLEGRVNIGPARAPQIRGTAPVTPMTITNEQYLERLEGNLPHIKDRLNRFIGKLELYGVSSDFTGVDSMILRWQGQTKNWNLGVIASSGAVFTDSLSAQARDAGLIPIAKQYLSNLATLVPGAELRPNKTETAWGVYKDNKSVRVDALLADDAQDGWLQAIAKFQEGVRKSPQGEDGSL
jgi:hypothetical protein